MYPPEELKLRRELGLAMLDFSEKLKETAGPQGMKDDVLRRVATEKFRRAVEKAADHKIEASLSWHTLAFWTEEGKERIGYFARALECRRAETAASPPKTPTEIWMDAHTQADCLFEIGRVHFYEGAFDAARRFLTKALPLAQAAEALEAAAGVPNDRLEGRIAELLLQLPEAEDEA